MFLLGWVDDGINNQIEATWEVGLGEDSYSEIISGDFHVSLLYSGGVYQAVQCLGLAFRRVVWAGNMCLKCPASPFPSVEEPCARERKSWEVFIHFHLYSGRRRTCSPSALVLLWG